MRADDRRRHFSRWALCHDISDKRKSCFSSRHKASSPNISFHMELQLIHSGIPDVLALRQVGARQAWLKLLTPWRRERGGMDANDSPLQRQQDVV
jgi:hypothetical protein